MFGAAEIQGKRCKLFWNVEQPTETGYKGPRCLWDHSSGRHSQVDGGPRASGSHALAEKKGYRQSRKCRDTEVYEGSNCEIR